MAENPRPALEVVAVGLLASGLIVTVLGTVGALMPEGYVFGDRPLHQYGMLGLILGIAFVTGGAASSSPLSLLRRITLELDKGGGGKAYDRLKREGRLRAFSLSLSLITLLGFVVLASAVAVRLGLFGSPEVLPNLRRGSMAVAGFIMVLGAMATYQSLRTPGPARSATGWVLSLPLIALMLVLLGIAIVLDVFQSAIGPIEPTDAPWAILAAAIVAGAALHVVRPLPGLVGQLREGPSRGTLRPSQGQRLLFPVAVGFSLVIVAFLAFVLVGFGFVGIITDVAADPLLMGIAVLFIVVFVASLGTAAFMARTTETDALYEVKKDPQIVRKKVLLTASLVSAALLVLPGVAIALDMVPGVDQSLWVHLVCIGLLVAIGPYGFALAREYSRVRRLEERFPDFLRDMASSHKGGLTLVASVAVAARGEYGPLTPEIRKMADQISWNVPFEEALKRFAERVRTPLVERAVNLILESDRSGGSTTDILLAAARDAREIKTLENDRRLSMSLYTVVIYITFFVFLTVAAILYSQFVPQLVAAQEAISTSNIRGGSSVFGGESISLSQFQLFYFMAAIMQGIGDGILAGMMGNGRAAMGLRHAFVMVLIAYVTFTVFLS